MSKIKNILFICYGNTCRSPAAEYLGKGFKQEKYREDLKNVNFDSSGFINAFSYMQPESRKYLDSKNILHSDFRPKLINPDLLSRQDLIITMEKHQAEDIIRNFDNIPNIGKITFSLKEFAGEKDDLDIIDPYMMGNRTYIKIMKEIEENVEKLIKKVIKVNTKD